MTEPNKEPMWYLRVAIALCLAGAVMMMVFFMIVWPPGAVLVLAIVLIAGGLIVDVPKKRTRPPGT